MSTLTLVRECVQKRKLQAKINAFFAKLLKDTGTPEAEVTDRERLLIQLAWLAGHHEGFEEAKVILHTEMEL